MTGRPGAATLNQCCCKTGRPPRTGGTLRPSWRVNLSNAVNSSARDRSLRSPSLIEYRLCGTVSIVIATSAQGIALSMRLLHHWRATTTRCARLASLAPWCTHSSMFLGRIFKQNWRATTRIFGLRAARYTLGSMKHVCSPVSLQPPCFHSRHFRRDGCIIPCSCRAKHQLDA